MAYRHLTFPRDSLLFITRVAGFIASKLCEVIAFEIS